MNAVWSFWSKPYLEARKSAWCSEKTHWLAWILSLQQARKFFGKTVLVTDDDGARMLVDGLQLEFDTVSTALNGLKNQDAKWWAMGKLLTYSLQMEPFVHIDSDVFLWKALPVDSNTPLFAQNPEFFEVGRSYYMPEAMEALIQQQGGWLPDEWRWFRASGLQQRAECCGVFGGGNTEFIRYYAKLALEMIEHPVNAGLWPVLGEHVERNILLEQYLLSACIEFWNHSLFANNGKVDIHYLFSSMDDAFNPGQAAKCGYTHLIADSKKDKTLANDLETRVIKDYPGPYEKLLDWCALA